MFGHTCHMPDIDFIPTQPHGQQELFPKTPENRGICLLKFILKIFLTKILDKYRKMYYISIRQRGKPRRRGENPLGPRDSDSLLHSLSSGLWTPPDSLECPISFSPFLPFGAFGNTGGRPSAFFYILNDYFSNTENSSQCALPINWSTGIRLVILYPPLVKILASRCHVCGLQET